VIRRRYDAAGVTASMSAIELKTYQRRKGAITDRRRLRDRQVPASGVARRLVRLRSAQAPPITRRRIAFAAELFQRLGFPRADANRRALLAYSTYLGYAQLVHATPQLLPQTQTARRAYLNDVLASLTSQPSAR
jgi:hypothetical protein